MQNEIEKLMRPRYEVIADYPNNPFTQNQVLVVEEWMGNYWYNEHGEAEVKVSDMESMPHLFREMEWWEGVAESEMPKYLKNKFSSQVLEVDRYHFNESKQAFVYFKNREFVEYLVS